MATAPVKEGDVLAGKYRVERVLGVGGMGVVVAARHQDLDQQVAVKFLLPEIAEHGDAAERFRREARAAVKITSEHVARVIDVGTLEEGVPYMVMEYLSGNDLSDELRKRGPLPVEEAVGFVLQACEAVAEAHAAGIVHRDLKPANLFLHKRADGTRIVKVLDFGISKSVGTGMDLALTSTAALIGSPLYMSPEQMHSAKSVDARTDIWSLGAILYQLLAGRPPYVGESLPQLCSALLNESPRPLADFRSDVPEGLEQALLGALTKDREQRYPGIPQFVRALEPYAAVEMQVHARRAERLLSSHDVSLDEDLTRVEGSSRGVEDVGHSATIPSTPPPGDRPSAAGASTQASWGKTDPGKPRSRVVPVAVVAVLVAGALVAFGISRTQAVAEPSAAAAAASAPAAEAPEPAVPEPAPTPQVTPEPSASAAADAGSAATSAAPIVTPPKVEVRAPRAVEKTVPKKPPSVPTDFGGRR